MTGTSRIQVIAEVAQTHDGSLGQAHAFIDAVAHTGADAIKFQTHIAAAESTAAEPWRVKFSYEDDTRYDYWQRMEFTEDQWRGLRQHALERGLQFLSSPFSSEAVDLLTRVGVAAWKVASGEVGNSAMFERMANTGWPFLVSTGLSTLAEIDAAVERIQKRGLPLTVLQCTSMYPTPPEKLGLNLIPYFRERYKCAVGLSDHSGSVFAGLAAATLGAAVIEVHATLSREMFGPDVAASLTTDELRQLVLGVRFIERALTNPVAKDSLSDELSDVRRLFTKSIVARMDLPSGTLLTQKHLSLKKPGIGIPAERLENVIGRRLTRNVSADELLSDADLD